jgi:4-amino-4-deoxy-L-arabinose transferase-like glycosyltransferase
VMSPLAVGLALYFLMRWIQSPRPSIALAACAGAAASMAMLTKYTNVAALFVVPVAVLIAWGRREEKRGRAAEVATLLFATVIPLSAWLIRCQLAFGDWTASRDKAAMLDWTVLTLEQSLAHPFFTVPGFFDFITRLTVTF